jgi:RNA polymerase sigma factor (sigma-70 family)
LIAVGADHSPGPDTTADRNEQALRIAEAIASLPDSQREAIESHYWHRHSSQQIADRQNKSKSAVAGAIRRGLKLLQTEIDPSVLGTSLPQPEFLACSGKNG